MSYKFGLFLQLIGILFFLLTFYYISKMIGDSALQYLKPYGGNYFAFVLIGIAFQVYLTTGLQSFSQTIRTEQMMGTLEAMLVTPTNVDAIIVFSSFWDYIFGTFRVIMLLLIGVYVFGVNMGKANIYAAIIILILTIVCFSSLGIISASFIIFFKQGDPINMLFGNISSLLGGVLYPTTLLPGKVQIISDLLPITYSLSGMRHALLQGYALRALISDIIPLVIFSIILLPLSILCFRYAVKKAMMNGSLVKY